MRQEPKIVNRATVLKATAEAINQLEAWKKLVADMADDPRREERRAKCQCVVCFYRRPQIVGHAMTERCCGLCLTAVWYPSTGTDVLCLKCAQENKLCKRCGGDVELKQRRKLYPFETQGGADGTGSV